MMITIIEGNMIGRVAGIALMAAAFCWLVYVMIMGGLVDVWRVMAVFWFGSSVFWQVSWYEKVR